MGGEGNGASAVSQPIFRRGAVTRASPDGWMAVGQSGCGVRKMFCTHSRICSRAGQAAMLAARGQP